MRFNYTIYSEAQEKLSPLNLPLRLKKFNQRVKKLNQNKIFPNFWGPFGKEEVESIRNEFKLNSFNQLIQSPNNSSWKINQKEQLLEEPVELEDIVIMMGYPTSFLLNSSEIKNYQKYGFDSQRAFLGTAGAKIWMLAHEEDIPQKGYQWESKDLEEKIWKNEVTGNAYCELQINQTDITPYKTLDPLGEEVQYRPEIEKDKRVVSADSYTEIPLLISLFKYINQTGLESEILKENGKSINDIFYKIKNNIPEDYFPKKNINMDALFKDFNLPIPILNKEYQTKQLSVDRIRVYHNTASYGIYIGPNKEIIFAYEQGKTNPKKQPSAIFQPQEVDNLIAGLFHQSLNQLGHTPLYQLVDVFNYKPSK